MKTCYICGYEDDVEELMPVDGEILFGKLVNKNTDYYCSDCIDLHYERLKN